MLSLLLYAVGMAAQQPDWGYNPNAYPDEHVIYVGLVDDQGSAVQSFNDNTYLGAFIEGECRGLAKVSRYSVSDTQTIYYFALRVKGTNTDNGKAISYRLSVGGNHSFVFNDLKPAANAVTYTNNGTTGKLSALYQLTFIRPGYYSIVQPEVSVKVGAEFNLLDHITFEPANANIPEMNWTMGQGEKENEYASIKGNTFKALKSTGKYSWVNVSPNLLGMKPTGQYTKVSVRVIQPATSIELRDEYKNGITVNLGDTAALNTVLRSGYTTAPADCNEELTWKSSDETAIRPMTSESDLGKFEPVKAGTYTMTLSGENASVDLKVTVIKQVEYIEMVGSVKTIKMFLGENLLDILPAGYKVMPEDATDRSVEYEVNQSNYWGMHEDGDGAYKYTDIFGDLYFNEGDEMIALKPGRVRVTINSTQNPRAYCEYEVIVKRGPTNITFKQEEMTFLMPRKDTDKWDISEDIRNNIIMTPSWPKYDEYEEYDIAQSDLDIRSYTKAVHLYYDFKNDILSASIDSIGQGWIDVSYSSERTIATEEGLQNDEYRISNHFNITILESLKGFKVDEYVEMVSTETRDFVLIPDPVDAEVDPSRVEVTIKDANVPEMWKSIVEIVPTDETMLNYTIKPHSVGRATISVKLDGVEVASSYVGIGQRYMQKAGWKWASLYGGGVSWNSPEYELGNVVEEIRSEDALLHNDPEYGYFGDLNSLDTGTCYKIKVKEEEPGLLDLRIMYTGAYEDMRTYRQIVPMWNWLGNPYQYDHDINSVFVKEENRNVFNVGDRIVSKDDGFAEYNGEKWTGTLTTLRAGLGYMYFNAGSENVDMELEHEYYMPQGTPVMNVPQHKQSVWTYNSAPFADNMTIVADLGNDYSAERFTVGAFVGDECRGEGEMIDGKCFITVHADKGETISFKLHDAVSGEMRTINEQLPFAKMAGSLRAPQRMTVGGIVTGITAADIASSGIAVVDGQITVQGMDVADVIVCNASGAVVSTGETTVTGLPSGVYVVKVKTKDGKTVTKKLVK
ncbi:T9SS type A sorting domain-containing protein [uncultured Prevotella sp.]|uniref:T9SS type A sorting domain-containing protein n=1 Tax=uncultured Prevotella sp. TaxID=159272 RepID=UPI0026DA8ABD|nr:T9SS type A sorting domain-containing protein [uncultured Prevotella sp.]